ncbi:sulfite exporter TauE/SafE family protein [Xanthomonas arboricola]|uniref:sulfite exporter TauE/SafE family protein n=1 Tax=Xanthomonas arboricola TaxID=56448 RepID=UPI000E1F44D8|nr:sulfite exporter TauE/SafE family protein [Xanthomonas arboricola]
MQTLHTHWYLIAGIFLLAGWIKGVAGMGLPTVAMGLLGLWLTPAEAAALLALPSLVTNVQQAWGPDTPTLLRRLWPLLATVTLGTWLSAGVLTGADPPLVRAGLGVLLALYALLGLARRHWTMQAHHERWAGPLAGLFTGLLSGATGVFVLPSLPYLTALQLPRELLIRSLGWCFGVATLALASALAWHGALPGTAIAPSMWALLPTAIGMWLGAWVRKRISADTFRRFFFATLLVLGLQGVWQALA